jgi:NO-binding membrane sensor protein with MHYT domain
MLAISVAVLAAIASMYLAGRVAAQRGRSVKTWVWIAAFIGIFAIPLLFILPSLSGREDRGASN